MDDLLVGIDGREGERLLLGGHQKTFADSMFLGKLGPL